MASEQRPGHHDRHERHLAAVRQSLAWADEAAGAGDHATALGWLDAVAAVGDEVPAAYTTKRESWLQAARAAEQPPT